MFSVRRCPIARAHSLRLNTSVPSEQETRPENMRARSPAGGAQDKTRPSPYRKQDKHLHRSMDSISPIGLASPILKRNPFFKLRPALALQPEVEKDIREAREREDELRRQRCALYGDNRQNREEDKSRCVETLAPGESAQFLSNSCAVKNTNPVHCANLSSCLT